MSEQKLKLSEELGSTMLKIYPWLVTSLYSSTEEVKAFSIINTWFLKIKVNMATYRAKLALSQQ